VRAVVHTRYGPPEVLRIEEIEPSRPAETEVLVLVEHGDHRAVIDRTYRLADIVEASRYVETQQKTGNVVLTVTS
jgi:NADPH:quinone reductase-like Zn-dependent oxidoreductase